MSKFLLSPGFGSWSLNQWIIIIVGFQNFVCCLAWAVDLGVQITDEGRSDLNSKINSPDQVTIIIIIINIKGKPGTVKC